MNYIKISPYDIANGAGVRVILWVAGCEHHCLNCHNPDTWDRTAGRPFGEAAMEELLRRVASPHVQGITFSGGDPLAEYNRATVAGIIRRIREELPEKDIWVYTGYTYEELAGDPAAEYVLDNADVLVDGPFVQALYAIDLLWKGSSNQRVIDLKATRKDGQVRLYCD